MTELDPAGLGAAAKAVAAYVGWPPGFRRDAEAAVRAYLASLPPDAEKNPYGPASHTSADTAWDEGYAEGFAAGRAAASPDPLSREAIEALPRWIAVEQAGGHHPNVNGPGPVMHAAVLLDDLLDLLAAPSHRGDEAAGTPATVLNTEPSSGAASPDERLREAETDT